MIQGMEYTTTCDLKAPNSVRGNLFAIIQVDFTCIN